MTIMDDLDDSYSGPRKRRGGLLISLPEQQTGEKTDDSFYVRSFFPIRVFTHNL